MVRKRVGADAWITSWQLTGLLGACNATLVFGRMGPGLSDANVFRAGQPQLQQHLGWLLPSARANSPAEPLSLARCSPAQLFLRCVRMLQCCCWLCSSGPEPLDALSSARDGLDLHGFTSAKPALPSPQGAAPRIRRLPCGLLCGNGECSSCLCMLLPRHLPAHNTPCQGCLVCRCSV